ncbi:MAG: YbaB/EbfC family nucleoid-associated protein [Candidatus Gastranaerophilales bacterium]|nr:YbaB/EbfC family nucleoid-associated protein [Candidatus Gastranaerophilales bacterium]
MFNMQQIMKQAQMMQKKAEEMQNELKNTNIEAQAGGGVVAVTLNAKNEFVSIKIKPEAINPDNPASVDTDALETLEDLIASAMKEANQKANATSEEKVKAITGGIKLPGLF